MKATKAGISGEILMLDYRKAIFWPRKNWLLIADFHIGKGAHFRSNGIAAPIFLNSLNLKNLNALLKCYPVQQVIFLGDLFHSRYNQDWESFSRLLKAYQQIKFLLITGNHDILDQDLYHQVAMETHLFLNEPPFCLTHHPTRTDELYNLAGHIHPGILLRGKARQSMRMPCFIFGERQGLLPAFGNFTGLATVKATKNDLVYGVAGQEVIGIQVASDDAEQEARAVRHSK